MARSKNRIRYLSTGAGKWLAGLGTLLVLLIILEVFGVTHLFHKQRAISGTIKTISAAPAKSATTQPSSSTPADSNVKTSTGSSAASPSTDGTASQSNPLSAPFGTFVSNHHPGANGTPTKEQSTCSTTPGATCSIRFTQGSVVRTLPDQTTDGSGNTSWLWDIGDAGLTSGSWNVSAVASLNGQTKSTTDPVALEVQ